MREAAIGNRPEAELLLCCARTSFEGSPRERARELVRGGLNWDFIVASALSHGIATLLYRNLCTIDSDAIPRDVRDTLGNWFQEMTERNERLVAELAEILHALQASGIDAIPFKGPLLAIAAYGNLSLRTFSDLDLIVRRGDIPAACEVLRSRGYVSRKSAEACEADERRPVRLLMHGRNNIQVDLQCSIEDVNFNFLLDRQEWRQPWEPITHRHFTFPTMPPEVTLLVLCVHGSKHLWERLIWISDVAEFLRSHPNLDWGQVRHWAAVLRRSRMLDLGLHMANELLGERPLDAPGCPAPPGSVQSVAPRIAARIFLERKTRTGPATRAGFYRVMEDRLPDRARYDLRIAIELHPDRTMWAVLPPHVVLLSFATHWLRRLGRRLVRTGPLVPVKQALLRWLIR